MSVRNGTVSSSVESDEEISNCVLEAVATLTGRDSTSLPVLNRTLDPDALNRLCRSGDGSLSVTFEYADCEVTIAGSDTVTIVDRDD